MYLNVDQLCDWQPTDPSCFSGSVSTSSFEMNPHGSSITISYGGDLIEVTSVNNI